MRNKTATSTIRKHAAVRSRTEAYFAKHPELREAIELFDVSMEQYAKALAHLNRPQIITTASSTPV